MIDKNKVKSAARGYCDATYGTLDRHPLIAEAFKEGANWAINEFLKDLWHPISEEPRKNVSIANIWDFLSDGPLIYVHKKWYNYLLETGSSQEECNELYNKIFRK